MYSCYDFLNKEHINNFVESEFLKENKETATIEDVKSIVAGYMSEYFLKRSAVVYEDVTGEYADKYTVLITEPNYRQQESYMFSMSEDPFHPCGISQFCGELTQYPIDDLGEWDTDTNKKMELKDVPPLVKKAIIQRFALD